MSGISSKAAGSLENKKKFNGIEYNNDFDLNIGEAFFRTHDPQIGRWWQPDPKAVKYYNYSPYCAMGNNPILIPDVLGDEIDIPYTETITNKKTGKTREVSRTFVWEPGKKYTGKGTGKGVEGLNATISALEKIYEKKDELNIKYTDDNGKEVSGNVLTDFLKGGKFEKVKATIFPDMEHNKSLNKKSLGLGIDIIWFNQKEGVDLLAYKEQAAGKQAPFFSLLHEFGHLWLNNVARDRMAAAVSWPNNARGNPVEEQLILDKVQNKRIADAYGQPQQIYYQQSAYGTRTGPLSNE
jgi:RHS repeat-associated protein